MKVLVTGATGFIGDYVVNYLLSSGDDVIILGRDIEKAAKFSWYSSITFVKHTIGEEISKSVMQQICSVDCLIHLAWIGLPNYNSIAHIEDNLMPQFQFLKLLIQNGIKDITITGTCFEYGMKNGPLDPSLPAEPTNPYAFAKNSLRIMLQFLQKSQQFKLKWVRLFYIYGKGQSKYSILSQLDKAIDEGLESFNMSGGEQLRDYLPIETIAKNIVLISKKDIDLGIVNICSGKPISIRNLVEDHLCKRNKKIKLNLGFYPYHDYEPMAFWGVPFKDTVV